MLLLLCFFNFVARNTDPANRKNPQKKRIVIIRLICCEQYVFFKQKLNRMALEAAIVMKYLARHFYILLLLMKQNKMQNYNYRVGKHWKVTCVTSKKRQKVGMQRKIKLHLKFGNPSFEIGCSAAVLIFSGWFPFPLLVAILLFRHIFMTSHMTLSGRLIESSQESKSNNSIKLIFLKINCLNGRTVICLYQVKSCYFSYII